VATYSANPVGTTFSAGGFYDVQVIGADPTDSVTARFYYPSTLTGLLETSLSLQYWTGSVWAPVAGSGGLPPVKNTTNNLDGTASGGRFTVTFDSTSTPSITDLSGTVFTIAASAVLEASIRFDPVSHDLIVERADGGSATVRMRSRDVGFAELRTYTLTDPGNNTLTVAVEVRKASRDLEAHIVSFRYGDAPAAAAPNNLLTYAWTTGRGGSLERLAQVAAVGSDSDRNAVVAVFSRDKNQTTILSVGNSGGGPITRDGLVLLVTVTDQGALRIRW